MAMTDVRERQRVYDKLGLKSWEIAKAEAELRRTTRQGEMSARQQQFGAPQDVALGKQFTEPSGIKRTYSEGGEQQSMTLPSYMVEPDLFPSDRERLKLLHKVRSGVATGDIVNYKDQYGPKDQKRIERLFEARSEALTDPEATEDERQRAIDMIDTQISRVPKRSPIMQEPTPQQKFDASFVTDKATGKRWLYDSKTGKFEPMEDQKVAQAETDKYNERFFKNLDAIRKNNTELINEGLINEGDSMDDPAMVDMARAMTDNEMGKTKGRRDSSMPEMDAAWSTTMADLNIENGFKPKKASEELMLAAMDQYVKMGIGKGMREVDAKADFLQRWESALGGGPYQALVPKMSTETRNKAQVVKAGTVREDDPISQQYGLGRGEGKAMKVSNGQVEVVNPSGEEGWIPLEDLDEALEEGYTLAQ